jgi:hypothetical protein
MQHTLELSLRLFMGAIQGGGAQHKSIAARASDGRILHGTDEYSNSTDSTTNLDYTDSADFTVHSSQFTLISLIQSSTVHTPQSTVHTPQSTVHSLQRSDYRVYTLQSLH